MGKSQLTFTASLCLLLPPLTYLPSVAADEPAGNGIHPGIWAVLALVILLGAAYTVLRMYTTRQSGRAQSGRKASLHEGQIDPNLQQAAEDYRLARQDNDGKHDKS